MKALTIWQPWAFAIVEGFDGQKNVENRGWHTKYRGPFFIHAGQTFDHGAVLARHSRPAAARLTELGGRSNFWDARRPRTGRPQHPTLAMSAVIGQARILDCHRCDGDCSPWADPDQWHWVLDDQVALSTPVPCPGRQQLWTPPEPVMTAVLAQLPTDAARADR